MQTVASFSPKFSYAEAVLSFTGAAIAGTIWWAHRSNIDLPCTADGGCDQVASSSWSHLTLGPWHDIPVSLLGLFGYVILLALSMMKIAAESPNSIRWLHRCLWAVAAGGFVYSWFLQYIAHFKIQAFCVWCFSQACVMTLLFFTAAWESRIFRKTQAAGSSPREINQTTHA